MSKKPKRKKEIPHNATDADKDFEKETIIFRFEYIKRCSDEQEWHVNKASVEDLIEVISKFESKTINEIFHQRTDTAGTGKSYPIDVPENSARKRKEFKQVCIDARSILALKADDTINLARLRFSGTGRLWGYREERKFFILFWDPLHEIYPSEPKNT